MTFRLSLGPSSATEITVYPEWDYGFQTNQTRSDMRTPAGKLYQYNFGSYQTFDLDLKYVPSSEAVVVNSWFDSNTKLLFFVTSGTATEVHSVVMMNDESPFNQFEEPNESLWKGSIELGTY